MVTTLNRQNPRRLDAAPTEVQMKLGISQVLSMPFAYNSPVIVLDFEVGNKNIIKGRFKDAIRSRVFEFEIGDSITFKPFTWRRTDSDVDPMAWEDFSKGYCYRFDAVKTVRKEKPKCGNTSYNCGKACIGLNKNCKSDPPDKPSQEKVDKLRAAAGEFKAVQGDPTKKQEDNKLTPKPPEVKEVAPTPSPDKAEVPVTDLAKQPPVALKIGKKSVNLKDDLDSYKDLRITADPVLGWQVINKNGDVLREPPSGNTAPSHRFKKREQAEKFANDVMTRVEKLLQKAQPKPDADVSDIPASLNDLKPEKIPKAKANKTPKQKAIKQKTIKVQGERSQEQESPLIPKEEIVKDAPKLIGDGTHEGAPKNAQEYYDAAVKTGKAMTMKEAEDTVAAVSGWSRSSNDIRNDQKKGKFNKKAELISDYVRNSTPYNGDIHRGIVFNNREEAMEWIKGDENGVLDNQNAHASWTSKESVAWVYTNPMMRKANKTLAGVIVSSVNKTGASIEKLSRYKESEAEVLVAKDARHKVKSVTEKDGILYVQTEEI